MSSTDIVVTVFLSLTLLAIFVGLYLMYLYGLRNYRDDICKKVQVFLYFLGCELVSYDLICAYFELNARDKVRLRSRVQPLIDKHNQYVKQGFRPTFSYFKCSEEEVKDHD